MIEGDAGNEKITLQFDYATSANNKNDDWPTGAWIENYATWETKEPGTWKSVVCSAEFSKEGGDFSGNVFIGNYLGNAISKSIENPTAITIPAASHTIFERTDDDQDYFMAY